MESVKMITCAEKRALIAESFSENIEKNHKQLMNYTFSLCSDWTLSADILQNAYCRAWMAIDSLNDWTRFKAWLKVIIYRENSRFFSTSHFHSCFDETLHSGENETAEQETSKNINEVVERLERLPHKYRTVVVLRLVGFCSKEIASKLNIPVNTVNTRMKRARKKLRGDSIF